MNANTLPDLLAVSVKAPWAWAILHAWKDIENRDSTSPVVKSKNAPWGIPVALHASGCGLREYHDAAARIRDLGYEVPAWRSEVRYALVGLVVFGRPAKASDSPWAIPGKVWIPVQARRELDPVPCKGQLGWFRPKGVVLPEEWRAALVAMTKEARERTVEWA